MPKTLDTNEQKEASHRVFLALLCECGCYQSNKQQKMSLVCQAMKVDELQANTNETSAFQVHCTVRQWWNFLVGILIENILSTQ